MGYGNVVSTFIIGDANVKNVMEGMDNNVVTVRILVIGHVNIHFMSSFRGHSEKIWLRFLLF